MFSPGVTTGVPIPTTFEEASRAARILPVSKVLNSKDKNRTYSKNVTVPELYEHPDGYTVYTIVLTACDIAHSKALERSGWMVSAEFGATTYEMAVPNNSLDQDSIEYRIETRYKDLLKLWQNLSLAHRQLHLRGTFPDFPKPKLIGRKEPGTVLERRAAAENLLDFAVKDPILCKASVLADFFENSKSEEISVPTVPDLTPSLAVTQLPSPATNSEPSSSSSPLEVEKISEEELPRTPDEGRNKPDLVEIFDPLLAYSPEDGSGESNQCLLEAMSQVERERAMKSTSEYSTPLPELFPQSADEMNHSASTNSIPVFAIEDCSLESIVHATHSNASKTHPSAPSKTTTQRSNTTDSGIASASELVDSANSEDDAAKPLGGEVEISVRDEPSASGVDSNTSRFNARSRIAKLFPKIHSNSQVEGNSSHGTRRTKKEDESNVRNGLKTTKSESNIVAILTSQRTDLVESPKSQSPNRLSAASPKKSRVKVVPGAEELDYLVQAAQFISSAQKSEAEAAYDLAFSCYKSAVNVMLQGVQFEKDLARRNAVRKKTAKYLLKAERIYRSQLAFDSSSFDVQKWAADFAVSSPSVQDPTLISFQGSYSELKSLKFIKQLGQNTILVSDNSAAEKVPYAADSEDAKYVLKFLDKTWYFPQQAGLTSITDNYVPLNVPFMVNLVKFYETEPCVILLLEHVSNGRLWTFLSDYFRWKRKKVPSSLSGEELPENEEESSAENQETEKPIFSPKNKYAGRKVLFSIGEEVEMTEEDGNQNAGEDSGRFENRAGSIFGQILGESSDRRSSLLEESDPEKVESAQNTVKDVLSKQDSICSDDSLSVDCGPSTSGAQSSSPSPSAPGLNSPNPDLKFQNVFRKLSAEMGVFSIIDEEGEDGAGGIGDFGSPAMVASSYYSSSSKTSPKRVSSGSKRDSLPTISEQDRSSQNSEDPASFSEDPFLDDEPQSEPSNSVKWPEGKDLPESVVKLWMGQLLVALTHLHAEGIILKHLRPRNLLLGNEGQLVLTYFSDWACVDRGLDLSAVDQLYSAPETGSATQELVSDTCDWWSVGAFIYELLSGWPLYSQCPQGIQSRTQIPFLSPDAVRKSPTRKYDLTKSSDDEGRMAQNSDTTTEPIFSSEAQDLMLRLLTVNPKERLGQGEGGVEDIRSHPFFRELHWPQIDIPSSSSR